MFVEVVRLCDNRGRGWEKGLPKEVSFFVVGDGKIKVRMAKCMRKMVKSHSLGTCFINHYSVSPIPTKEFINTNRKLFGWVTQTLSGHGYMGEYYSRMKLDVSPWCLCSANPGAPVFHTCYHVLQECSRHASSRHYLLTHNPDLHDASWDLALLGELKTRLSSLISFMSDSSTFTKLDIPFSLNLILPPACPKKPL